MSLVVNFFAGPGAGKSTLSAGVFHHLKDRGIQCELVLEYVKEWAWDGRNVRPIDEMVIYGRQLERERRFYDKDMIVLTDRPLELSAVYADVYGGAERRDVVLAILNSDRRTAKDMGARFLNVRVARQKPYSEVGRFEDEEGARLIDRVCDDLVETHIYYTKQLGISKLADTILACKGDL